MKHSAYCPYMKTLREAESYIGKNNSHALSCVNHVKSNFANDPAVMEEANSIERRIHKANGFQMLSAFAAAKKLGDDKVAGLLYEASERSFRFSGITLQPTENWKTYALLYSK